MPAAESTCGRGRPPPPVAPAGRNAAAPGLSGFRERAGVRGAAVQLAVEVHRRADQGKVAERLREIADLLASGCDLLRVQAQRATGDRHEVDELPHAIRA